MLLCVYARFTRQAALFAVCMMLLSVPSHSLVTSDLSSSLVDLKAWLQG